MLVKIAILSDSDPAEIIEWVTPINGTASTMVADNESEYKRLGRMVVSSLRRIEDKSKKAEEDKKERESKYGLQLTQA